MPRGGFCRAFEQDIAPNASLLRREALPRSHHAKAVGRGSMSRPERGKGGCHARENGWLALSTLVLQYQRHISRVLRLRADADARREFQLMTRMRSAIARLPTAAQSKTCSARPNRGRQSKHEGNA